MRPRVTVVGSSNTDLIVRVERLPRPGETILGGEFLTAPGGKGANQAVAAARLGGEVTFIARVGLDSFGDESVENFKRDGIITDYVFRDPDSPSGVALIFVGPDGRNMIVVAPGANGRLSPDNIRSSKKAIASADVLLTQFEIPLDTVSEAISIAFSSGVPVILNPAPAMEVKDELLRMVTFLTPNETEASILSGIEVREMGSAEKAAKELLRRGVENVIVTLGEEGAVYVREDESRHIPAFKVQAVDTTAAGDVFNGAFACAIASGRSPIDAIRFANKAAAISVTRMGAQPSIPTLEEVNRRK
jgi:ribokinase